jgi:protein-S-isoprenylcysteine O-methyltransferase Ste14
MLFGVVSGVAYLWLAILGWGGFEAFFSHPAFIVLIASTIVMCIAALFTEGNISSGVREDKSNRWVFLVFGAVGLLSSYLPAYMDRMDLWTIDGEITRWLGVVLYLAGGTLRMWPVFVLGRRFSGLVAIQPGHKLVTNGLYSVIRHPSYMGLLLGLLGWALAFRSSVGVLLTLLTLWPLLARIKSEEALLSSEFGTEYDAYRTRTRWRLLPGIF